MGQSQLKNKVDMLRQENEKMQGQCMPVQQHLRDMKLSSKYQQDTSDHRTQQLQQDLEKIGKKMEEGSEGAGDPGERFWRKPAVSLWGPPGE